MSNPYEQFGGGRTTRTQRQQAPILGPSDPYRASQERRAEEDQNIQRGSAAIAASAEGRQRAVNTWAVLSPDDAAQLGLPAGGTYQRNGLGEIKTVIEPPKGGDPKKSAQTIVDSLGIDLRGDNDRISKLIRRSTSGGLQQAGANAYAFITGDATDGMKAIGQLTPISADLTLQMTGGSLGNQISNSDRDFIKERMGDVANPEKTADERLEAWKEVKRRLANSLGIVIGQQGGQSSESQNSQAGRTRMPAMLGDLPVGTDIEFGMDRNERAWNREAYLQERYGISPNQEAAVVAFWNANIGNPNIDPARAAEFYRSQGLTVSNEEIAQNIAKAQEMGDTRARFGDIDTSDAERDFNARLDAEMRQRGIDPASLSGASGSHAAQGILWGGLDEVAGIGGAIATGLQGGNPVDGYRFERDLLRRELEMGQDARPVVSTLSELGGGLASGGVGYRGVKTAGDAAKVGALTGAAAGFNYGEGAGGSIANAALGGGVGAGLGYGSSRLWSAIGDRVANRAASRAQMGERAQGLSDAGQAEGVTVNRAMVDPALENTVAGVDATLVGGPIVQRNMRNIADQMGDRVARLGRDGVPLNPEEAGGVLRESAERFIERTGKAANRKYNRAEQLAGNAKVEPRQSLKAVDEMITTLSETPGQNSAEIAFLQTLKDDLGQDLSVGALRRMRTSMRKRISNGGLTFGEDEARVLEIMNRAADDIRAGLQAQGKDAAARAFDAADKSYRARMDYISGTIQKVIGRKNGGKSSEQVFSTLSSMAKGKDAAGLRKFYATLDPEEAADVAATFAEQLGKSGQGDFSVSHFMTQSNKFSESALLTLFGKDGARSVHNLRVLGKEAERVQKAMNSRKSGTAVALGWRGWLIDAIFGASLGSGAGGLAIGGSGWLTGAAAGASVAGLNAGRNILSARALMSPNITHWLRSAPRTASPKAINEHFAKLEDIAHLEPAMAGEIDALRQALIRAANENDLVTKSAAGDDNSEE